MKAIKLMGLATFICVISACSGSGGSEGSDNNVGAVSIDSSGNCSATFISDINNIIYETKILKDYFNKKRTDSEIFHQAELVINACDLFFSKHDNVTCMAKIDDNETSVSNAKIKPNCEAAQQILDLQNSSK